MKEKVYKHERGTVNVSLADGHQERTFHVDGSRKLFVPDKDEKVQTMDHAHGLRIVTDEDKINGEEMIVALGLFAKDGGGLFSGYTNPEDIRNLANGLNLAADYLEKHQATVQ